ncbi:hypothetical protein FF011L_28250 [Roseimaritima multifibrata]|uniref:Uncharacterized protein n=1 Tax=Roseimaritima multifibrata TaxID=1930274 RepID=A0A517MGN6_9BACT|nr:hypothetical protein [Roseimaritima multifibrata]QDS94048.1 hypothetical protein FF011L_28250 [Roseimaritima multifibrata]
MNVRTINAILGLLVAIHLLIPTPVAVGAPPQIGDASPAEKWVASLSPSNWKLPTWSSTDKPSKKKTAKPAQKSTANQISQSVGRGWQKTTAVMNPMNLFPSTSTAVKSEEDADSPGFFERWFTPPEEPKKIETINDFLRQPSPY